MSFPLGWEERKAMKDSKFSDAQKAFILKLGADGIPVAEICRKAGIIQATPRRNNHWAAKVATRCTAIFPVTTAMAQCSRTRRKTNALRRP